MAQGIKIHGDGLQKKPFIELMDCLYLQYSQITPVDLMQNEEETQETYNAEDTTNILFYQIETGQELLVSGNSSFSDRQLADMGVEKILATQKYTHAYCMWKSIADDDCT